MLRALLTMPLLNSSSSLVSSMGPAFSMLTYKFFLRSFFFMLLAALMRSNLEGVRTWSSPGKSTVTYGSKSLTGRCDYLLTTVWPAIVFMLSTLASTMLIFKRLMGSDPFFFYVALGSLMVIGVLVIVIFIIILNSCHNLLNLFF